MTALNDLIQHLEESHRQFDQLVSEIGQNQEIYPGWTIREILVHLTGWDEAVIASLKLHADGHVPTVVSGGDHDFHNAARISGHGDLGFEQIYQEWQHTHEQLKIAIQSMPAEKIEAQFIFPWGQTGNIEDLVIGLTSEHEELHANDIRALLKE